VHGPEVTDDGAATKCEFLHVGLAQQHSAGSLESAHHLGIFRRNAILKHSAGSSRLYAGRIEQVLQGNRDTMKRPAPLSALYLGFGVTRLFQG